MKEGKGTDMMDGSFKIEKDGNVAWLILNRPEKRNSMTWEFFAELAESFRAFDDDPEVRAVVIRAEGKMFTAGLDLVAAGSLLGDGSAAVPGGAAAGRSSLSRRRSAPSNAAASPSSPRSTASASAAGWICSPPATSGWPRR